MESAAGNSQTPSGRAERGGRSYSGGGGDDEWVEQTGVAAFPGELRYQPAGFSTIEPSFSKSGEVGCPPAELKIRAGGNSSAESSAVEEPYHFTGFSDVPSPATALNVEEHQPQNALAQPCYADDIFSPYQDLDQNQSPTIAIPLRFHDPNHSLGEVIHFTIPGLPTIEIAAFQDRYVGEEEEDDDIDDDDYETLDEEDDNSPRISSCCICMADFSDGEGVGDLECGHKYHESCIREWLRSRNTCPLCRNIVNISKN